MHILDLEVKQREVDQQRVYLYHHSNYSIENPLVMLNRTESLDHYNFHSNDSKSFRENEPVILIILQL